MKYLFICLFLFLTSCQTTPINPEFWMEKQINACLPTAVIFKKSLNKYDVWSEVVIYSWKDTKTGRLNGHAIVAYLYPPGKNQLWTYDSQGSFRTRAYTNNVLQVAQQAHWARDNKEVILSAEYLK